MATDDGDWNALAEVVRSRRRKLDLRQGDLEARGGPGQYTVRDVERAVRDNYSARTFRSLETALLLEEGTLERVLSGELSAQDIDVSGEGVKLYAEERLRQYHRDHPPGAQDDRQTMAARAQPAGDPSDPSQRIRGATGALARAVDVLTRNPSPSDDEEIALGHIMDALGQLRAPVEWDEAAQRFWIVDRG